ncbi:protein FAM136A [Lingula anatina]|uniref:Protein FAM136A n=1 Tax=Lingula anatina TaxID=7574 RepID=A0A1S3HBD8_LINAN|nr:protein FAM136A [Lingula anatina]|eukprot:XP_013383357.1 protein FAM136A [Lingula anatina]
MAENPVTHLENSLKKTIDEVDKERLRFIQIDFFKCATKCCENKDLDFQERQSCNQKCGEVFDKASAYVEQEVGNFQNRLKRCFMDCHDMANDQAGNKGDNTTLTQKFLKDCGGKCVNKYLDLLPTLKKRMLENLSK